MSPELFASASTMSLPLCSVFFLISIPCAEKKPFEIPRSIGSPFAIGSVLTVTVTRGLLGALVAPTPNTARAASAAARIASGIPPRRAEGVAIRLILPLSIAGFVPDYSPLVFA